MKVSPEARRLPKYKEKREEISVATLQFDITFCTSILCAPAQSSLDRGFAGSKFNGDIALCPRARHLVLVQLRKPSDIMTLLKKC